MLLCIILNNCLLYLTICLLYETFQNVKELLQVQEYVNKSGVNHYRSWFDDLDVSLQVRIQTHIDRLTLELGDVKSVGSGVSELRLHFGAGYRVYFARRDKKIVLLLCGGDKGTQRRDIRLAQSLWSEAKAEGSLE